MPAPPSLRRRLGKVWRLARAVVRDRGLAHLPLEVDEHQGTAVAKILVDRLSPDERWLVAERMLVEDFVSIDPATRRRAAAMLLSGEDVAVSFTAHGTRWTVPAGDEILASMLGSGAYEREEIEAVIAFLDARPGSTREAQTVFDIGAHVGTSSIPFAQAGYSVVAVEPVSTTFELLCRNVADNELTRAVRCLQGAVSPEGGTVEIALGGGSGQSEVIGPGQRAGHLVSGGYDRSAVERVRSVGLAEITAEADVRPDEVALVWSDTQGCETHVIRSGAALWAAGAMAFIEVWPEALANHEGVSEFVGQVETHFGSFVASEVLQRTGAAAEPRPIDQFGPFVRGLAAGSSTDVLLIPGD